MSDKISIEALDVKASKLTVTGLAEKINAEIHKMGADRELLGFSTLEAASEGDVSFVIKKKYLSEATMSQAKVIVAPKGMIIEEKTTLCVNNIWEAVLFLLNHFYPVEKPVPGIHDSVVLGKDVSLGRDVVIDRLSVISDKACIGDNSIIGAQVYVGKNVKIGKDCMIHPNVTLLDRCEVGDRVILHSGIVIGSDGFKYELIEGLRTKIPQVGKVVIEDDVEIGANTTIDRASITETRIKARTKIDNLVQIAHNVTIGTDCYIVAQCGIAGSTTIGDRCILAGQVGIVDNVNITDDVIIGAQSGVSKDYKKPGMYIGSPAIERNQFLRLNAILSRLPTMYEDIKKLKQQLAQDE